MGISFKEYFAAFGKWGFIVAAIIVGDIIGIVQSVDQKFILPQLVWWLVLVLILVLSPVIAFHQLRLRRDELQKELDGIKNSRPNVEYESVSASLFQGACYLRLVFRNKVVEPSGHISTSQSSKAKIKIFTASGLLVDSWDGRWAENDWPASYGDIPEKNKRDIIAGDPATLDIGVRILGQVQFKGHYNRLSSSPELPRKLLEPDFYYVSIELWAANMLIRDPWFTLQIPNVPQSNDTEQVKITPTKTPEFCKEGFQTE